MFCIIGRFNIFLHSDCFLFLILLKRWFYGSFFQAKCSFFREILYSMTMTKEVYYVFFFSWNISLREIEKRNQSEFRKILKLPAKQNINNKIHLSLWIKSRAKCLELMFYFSKFFSLHKWTVESVLNEVKYFASRNRKAKPIRIQKNIKTAGEAKYK